jgi:hypothetical protein
VTMLNAGHVINIEEPNEYNRIVSDLLAQAKAGVGQAAIPVLTSITGMKDA